MAWNLKIELSTLPVDKNIFEDESEKQQMIVMMKYLSLENEFAFAQDLVGISDAILRT